MAASAFHQKLFKGKNRLNQIKLNELFVKNDKIFDNMAGAVFSLTQNLRQYPDENS